MKIPVETISTIWEIVAEENEWKLFIFDNKTLSFFICHLKTKEGKINIYLKDEK